MIRLGCFKLADDVVLPEKATSGSACLDIRANFHQSTVKIDGRKVDLTFINSKKSVRLLPGEVILVPTGIIFIIPENYQLKIVPRSGYAWKNKITVLNTPGTIDEDYDKETFVMLINLGDRPFIIEDGMKIAQCELVPNITKFTNVFQADDGDLFDLQNRSDRDGGFGSTGA